MEWFIYMGKDEVVYINNSGNYSEKMLIVFCKKGGATGWNVSETVTAIK